MNSKISRLSFYTFASNLKIYSSANLIMKYVFLICSLFLPVKEYTRVGRAFVVKNKFGSSDFKLIYESSTDILLYESVQLDIEAGFFIVSISKKDNSFSEYYVKSNDVTTNKKIQPSGGKCLRK
jgi:hypothetical protein